MRYDFLDLVLTVLAIRTKDHDDRSLLFAKVIAGKRTAIGYIGYFKWGDNWKSEIDGCAVRLCQGNLPPNTGNKKNELLFQDKILIKLYFLFQNRMLSHFPLF
jgi:hypothetical protein